MAQSSFVSSPIQLIHSLGSLKNDVGEEVIRCSRESVQPGNVGGVTFDLTSLIGISVSQT
jgi:hypothetical protein